MFTEIKSKPKVVVTRNIPEIGLNLLRKHFNVFSPEQNQECISKKELHQKIQGAFALIPCAEDKIDAELMNAAGENLKIIANYAVGFNNIDLKEAKKRKIFVTNTPNTSANSVAEFTMSLLLALSKKVVDADQFVRDGKYEGWNPSLFLGSELKSKKLGVIGLGQIGIELARKAHFGLDMQVLYYDLKRNTNFEKITNAQYLPIEKVLSEADVISLHVPLNESTHHLIRKQELEMMKKDACLINTARGAVIDEKALVKHLQEKKIAGAALDVYENEPEVPEQLKQLENVILTPHIASSTYEAREQMAVLAAQCVIDAYLGKVPACLVS